MVATVAIWPSYIKPLHIIPIKEKVVTFFYVWKLKLNREKYNKLFIGGDS